MNLDLYKLFLHKGCRKVWKVTRIVHRSTVQYRHARDVTLKVCGIKLVGIKYRPDQTDHGGIKHRPDHGGIKRHRSARAEAFNELGRHFMPRPRTSDSWTIDMRFYGIGNAQ